MNQEPKRSVEDLFEADGRYPVEAAQFVREGLNHTIQLYHSQETEGGRHHVGGRQLCEGLRDLAAKRWGYMARSVLESWNVKETRDFGEIVFLLVNNRWMQKEDDDRPEDFDDVYGFEEAFDQKFEFEFE